MSIRLSMKKMAKLKKRFKIDKVAKGRIVDHLILFFSQAAAPVRLSGPGARKEMLWDAGFCFRRIFLPTETPTMKPTI